MIRAGEAAGAFNRETKRMQSALSTSLSQISKQGDGDIVEQVNEVERLTLDLPKLQDITSQAVALKSLPDIIPDDWLTRNREKIDAALAEAMRLQSITDEINDSFNNAIAASLTGATQALVDCVAGIEGADAGKVLAAFLQPFANTMTQLGEMLLLEGLGIKAFKESLKSLNPAVAIGAGLALTALGAALSVGISALADKASSSTAATTSAATSSASVSSYEFKSEQTIYVKGKISGADIIIAGDNQRNKWSK
jgi:hypothetical protein